MKFLAFLLVLLSAFCAAFARYDVTNGARQSALLRTGGSRGVATSGRALKSDDGSVTTNPLDDETDNEDDMDGEDDSDDDKSEPDDEADFDSDVESIDGESDDDCVTGQYTLKYMPSQRFAFGKKSKRIKVKNLRACGRACAKNRGNCNTFNFNKKKKQCQMFTTKSIGRSKVKDTAGTAAYLACVE